MEHAINKCCSKSHVIFEFKLQKSILTHKNNKTNGILVHESEPYILAFPRLSRLSPGFDPCWVSQATTHAGTQVLACLNFWPWPTKSCQKVLPPPYYLLLSTWSLTGLTRKASSGSKIEKNIFRFLNNFRD